jgi:hypothetical protein
MAKYFVYVHLVLFDERDPLQDLRGDSSSVPCRFISLTERGWPKTRCMQTDELDESGTLQLPDFLDSSVNLEDTHLKEGFEQGKL